MMIRTIPGTVPSSNRSHMRHENQWLALGCTMNLLGCSTLGHRQGFCSNKHATDAYLEESSKRYVQVTVCPGLLDTSVCAKRNVCRAFIALTVLGYCKEYERHKTRFPKMKKANRKAEKIVDALENGVRERVESAFSAEERTALTKIQNHIVHGGSATLGDFEWTLDLRRARAVDISDPAALSVYECIDKSCRELVRTEVDGATMNVLQPGDLSPLLPRLCDTPELRRAILRLNGGEGNRESMRELGHMEPRRGAIDVYQPGDPSAVLPSFENRPELKRETLRLNASEGDQAILQNFLQEHENFLMIQQTIDKLLSDLDQAARSCGRTSTDEACKSNDILPDAKQLPEARTSASHRLPSMLERKKNQACCQNEASLIHTTGDTPKPLAQQRDDLTLIQQLDKPRSQLNETARSRSCPTLSGGETCRVDGILPDCQELGATCARKASSSTLKENPKQTQEGDQNGAASLAQDHRELQWLQWQIDRLRSELDQDISCTNAVLATADMYRFDGTSSASPQLPATPRNEGHALRSVVRRRQENDQNQGTMVSTAGNAMKTLAQQHDELLSVQAQLDTLTAELTAELDRSIGCQALPLGEKSRPDGISSALQPLRITSAGKTLPSKPGHPRKQACGQGEWARISTPGDTVKPLLQQVVQESMQQQVDKLGSRTEKGTSNAEHSADDRWGDGIQPTSQLPATTTRRTHTLRSLHHQEKKHEGGQTKVAMISTTRETATPIMGLDCCCSLRLQQQMERPESHPFQAIGSAMNLPPSTNGTFTSDGRSPTFQQVSTCRNYQKNSNVAVQTTQKKKDHGKNEALLIRAASEATTTASMSEQDQIVSNQMLTGTSNTAEPVAILASNAPANSEASTTSAMSPPKE